MSDSNPDPKTGQINIFSPEFASCPQPVYRRTLSQCPVTTAAWVETPVITRYEDVLWCMHHPEIFSSEMEIEIDLGTERPMIPQQIDPPAQTKFRKILDPRFSRKRMKEIEPGVRADANTLIDSIIDAGECEFNKAFAVPLPCNAFLRLMGLPASDLDLFLRLKDGIIRPHTLTESMEPEDHSKLRHDTGQEIYAYFRDLIAKRRGDPKDDLMTYFLQAEIAGERLSDNDILDICFLFLLAGLDTVTSALGCNIAYLAGNPKQRSLLLEDASVIPSAVEELLRWETPVTGVPRVLKQDVTLGGVDLKEGTLVTLLIGASNVDDEEFGNANEVDLKRERNRHLAFGGGAHRCLGSHLARLELCVAMEEWHRRIPQYEIKPGEVPTYSPGIREVQYLPLVW